MKLIYVSSGCSRREFARLVKNGYNHDLPQAQKYHLLLAEGLAEIDDVTVLAVTARPIDASLTRKKFFRGKEERCGKVHYQYLPLINLPLLRPVLQRICAKKMIRKKRTHDSVIVCDIWNQSIASAARQVGKRFHIPVIGIITDLPGHRSDAYKKQKKSLGGMLAQYVEKRLIASMQRYDGYLFLAKAMNEIANPNGRPYLVLEGHSDIQMLKTKNELTQKEVPYVMMYAGTLHRQYGIQMLVEAFLAADNAGWELHIYGTGDYAQELEQIVADYGNVKYFGRRDNDDIIRKQKTATLLVNPRPTDADFVKYSFPSKTMECMASGTPLLTTRLPSMPVEYQPYVYLFEEENTEAYTRILNQIFSRPKEALHEKGRAGKEFILKERNNVQQARRFYEFLTRICKMQEM